VHSDDAARIEDLGPENFADCALCGRGITRVGALFYASAHPRKSRMPHFKATRCEAYWMFLRDGRSESISDRRAGKMCRCGKSDSRVPFRTQTYPLCRRVLLGVRASPLIHAHQARIARHIGGPCDRRPMRLPRCAFRHDVHRHTRRRTRWLRPQRCNNRRCLPRPLRGRS